MNLEDLLLILIGISLLGFIIGLVGKNTRNIKRKTFRNENVYTILMAVSVTLMLVLAFIYKFLSL